MLIVYAKEADKTLYLSTVSQSGKTTRHKLSISTGRLKKPGVEVHERVAQTGVLWYCALRMEVNHGQRRLLLLHREGTIVLPIFGEPKQRADRLTQSPSARCFGSQKIGSTMVPIFGEPKQRADRLTQSPSAFQY